MKKNVIKKVLPIFVGFLCLTEAMTVMGHGYNTIEYWLVLIGAFCLLVASRD